jgi:hypothetical protein
MASSEYRGSGEGCRSGSIGARSAGLAVAGLLSVGPFREDGAVEIRFVIIPISIVSQTLGPGNVRPGGVLRNR